MADDLHRCPCGAIPEKLLIYSEHEQPKFAFVQGDCCDYWYLEFRNDHCHVQSAESMERATKAWNTAPHGKGNDEP